MEGASYQHQPHQPLLFSDSTPVSYFLSKIRLVRAWMLSRFSCVWIFVTPWTVAHQAPLSMGFSRQEYWRGLPFSSPGDLPAPGIKPGYPALQEDSLHLSHQGSPNNTYCTLRVSYASMCLLVRHGSLFTRQYYKGRSFLSSIHLGCQHSARHVGGTECLCVERIYLIIPMVISFTKVLWETKISVFFRENKKLKILLKSRLFLLHIPMKRNIAHTSLCWMLQNMADSGHLTFTPWSLASRMLCFASASFSLTEQVWTWVASFERLLLFKIHLTRMKKWKG